MQPPTRIRKILLNKLIVDLAALTKEAPDSGVVFPVVSKYFYDIPTSTPALYLASRETNRQDPNNLSFDNLNFGFTAYVYETLEAAASQTAINTKIDRLIDCESYLYKYVAKIPNNVGEINGVTVFDSAFIVANYLETDSPQGRAMGLAFGFDLSVNVNVQLIN